MLTFTIYVLYSFIYVPSYIVKKDSAYIPIGQEIKIPTTSQNDTNSTLFVLTRDETIKKTIPTIIEDNTANDDEHELSPEEIIEKENELYEDNKKKRVIVKPKRKLKNMSYEKLLSLAKPMKAKMKIKAKEKNGVVKVKVMFTSLMVEKEEAEKKKINSKYITYILARVADKVVFEATTSGFMSENPLFKFSFLGAKKGDELEFIVYGNYENEIAIGRKKIR